MSSIKNIWIVVPFYREHNLKTVVENFKRQTFTNKRLVIVENGTAIGSCDRAGFKPDMLLTSETHQAVAKNTALDEIRRRGGGYWTTFDDDDWYGQHHVQEIVDNAHKATACGRGEHFVRLANGLHLFREQQANRYSDYIAGPTISCWVEDAIPFEKFTPGDTLVWCDKMRAKGATLWNCDFRHFVYNRLGKGHAWEANDIEVRCAYGDARNFGDAPNEIVECIEFPNSTYVPRPTSIEVFEYLETLPFQKSVFQNMMANGT